MYEVSLIHTQMFIRSRRGVVAHCRLHPCIEGCSPKTIWLEPQQVATNRCRCSDRSLPKWRPCDHFPEMG